MSGRGNNLGPCCAQQRSGGQQADSLEVSAQGAIAIFQLVQSHGQALKNNFGAIRSVQHPQHQVPKVRFTERIKRAMPDKLFELPQWGIVEVECPVQAGDACMTRWNPSLQVHDKFSEKAILYGFIEDFLCQQFIALVNNPESTNQDATMPRLIAREFQPLDKPIQRVRRSSNVDAIPLPNSTR